MRTVDTAMLEFVTFGGEAFDRRGQIVAANGGDYLLDDTV